MPIEHVKCIACDKSLENLWIEDCLEHIQPMEGLAFLTYGHYGSTVFDPVMTGEYLEIVVCDACILKKLEHVHGTGAKSITGANYD